MKMTLKKLASMLGARGGKKSAQVRLGGLTKDQRSDAMRKIRYSKKETSEIKKMSKELVKNLNRNLRP